MWISGSFRGAASAVLLTAVLAIAGCDRPRFLDWDMRRAGFTTAEVEGAPLGTYIDAPAPAADVRQDRFWNRWMARFRS